MKKIFNAMTRRHIRSAASSTGSSRGRPRTTLDWLSSSKVEDAVIELYSTPKEFQDAVLTTGLRPMSRIILQLLASKRNENKELSTNEEMTLSSRVRNWIAQYDASFSSSDMEVVGGLQNLGNTCYFNVCIQILRSMYPIREALQAWQPPARTELRSSKMELLYDCGMVLKKVLWKVDGTPVTSTEDVVAALQLITKDINLYNQQDLDEIFMALANVLEEILKSPGKCVVQDTLQGGVIESLTCSVCSSKREHREVAWGLQLSIPAHAKEVSLTRALELHFEVETLAGDEAVKCDTCKSKTKTVKSAKLEKQQEYMTVLLKRTVSKECGSVMKRSKLRTRITYPENLDVRKFSSQSCVPVYDLHCVAVHEGPTFSKGHYYVYTKHGDQWMKCNDSVVTKCSLNEVLMDKNDVCVLVYRKTDTVLEEAHLEDEISESKVMSPLSSIHIANDSCWQKEGSQNAPGQSEVSSHSSLNGWNVVNNKKRRIKKQCSSSDTEYTDTDRHRYAPTLLSGKWNASTANCSLVNSPVQNTENISNNRFKQLSDDSSEDEKRVKGPVKKRRTSSENESPVSSNSYSPVKSPEKIKKKSKAGERPHKRNHSRDSSKSSSDDSISLRQDGHDSSKTDFSNSRVFALFPSIPRNASSEDEVDSDEDEIASGKDASSEKPKTRYGRKLLTIGNTLRLSSKNYSRFEFSVSMTQEDWDKCIVVQKSKNKTKVYLNRNVWPDKLLDHIEKADKGHHTFKFKSISVPTVSRQRGVNIDAYGYCRSGECKWFLVAVEIVDVMKPPLIEVYSHGETNHPANVQSTRPLNGQRRRRVRQILEKEKVSAYQDNQIANLPDSAYQEGHLGAVKSDAVLHNVRSEGLKKGDLHTDDLIDVILRKRRDETSDKQTFVQSASEPFNIHLFSKKQVAIIVGQFKSWKMITVHIDATGSLIRRPLHINGRIYLYAGVVNISGTVIPLFEMISVQHNQKAIGDLLADFRTVCTTGLNKNWPCVGRVVLDCCFAAMHAAILQCNRMSLEAYLRLCFKYANGVYTNNDFGTLILLQLCKNHWQKMMSTNLKNHSLKNEKKHLVLEGTASLQSSKTLKEFVDKFKAFCALLLSKKIYRITSEAAATLALGTRTCEEILGVGPHPEDIEEEGFTAQDTLASSPFFHLCYENVVLVKNEIKEIQNSMDDEELSALDDNPAFCKWFLKDVFLPRCSPIVPLWTEIMSGCRESFEYESPSNANAEDYFNILKNDVHDIMHNKAGRFIQIERDFIEKKLIKVDRKLITNSKSFKKYFGKVESVGSGIKKEHQGIKINESCTQIFSINQGRKGEKQEEPWKLNKFVKKEHKYSDAHKLKKTYLETASVKDDSNSEIDEKNIVHPRNGEKDEEFWNSPPASEKKAVKRPALRKEASLSKNSTKKLLSEMLETSAETSSSGNGKDIILSQIDIFQTLRDTYYGCYAQPQITFFSNMPNFSKLSKVDVMYVQKTCRGDRRRPVLIYGDEDRCLLLEDFGQLLGDGPLSTSVIDACLHCLSTDYECIDRSICVLSSTEGSEIFHCEFRKTLSVNKRRINDNASCILIIPYLLPGHWVVCVADMKSKSFQLLDPAGKDKNQETQLKLLFESYLQNSCDIEIDFELNNAVSYPLQNDNVNCGIFILKFTKCILQGQYKIHPFSCSDFRLSMARLCIARGRDIMNESELAATSSNLLHKRYDNGLFKSVDYYAMRIEDNDEDRFVVSVFGEGISTLFSHMYSAVVQRKWLSNHVIDAAFHVNMTEEVRRHFINVSCNTSNLVLGGAIDQYSVLANINISGKTLLMPTIVNGNHWCLAVANIPKKRYCFLDPLQNLSTSHMMDRFLAALKKRNNISKDVVEYKNWKCDANKFVKQTDSTNCGIFVIYYGLCIMKVLKSSKMFDPEKYRNTLAITLLEKTPTMRHLCPKCGQTEYDKIRCKDEEDIIGQMVQCFHCHRWYHRLCDEQLKGVPLIRIVEDDFIFSCTLCIEYMKKFPSRKRKRAKVKGEQH